MHTNPAPTILLVRPQLGENIGMCARAMLNCGLQDLALTAPRDGWPSDKAVSASAGALDMMPDVAVYDDLPQALETYHYVYATTGKLHPVAKPVLTARGAAVDMKARIDRGEKIAILFGPERSGLHNDDLIHAHAFVTFQSNPDFASFNIAQSVLLMAYEWMLQAEHVPDVYVHEDASPPAPHAQVEALCLRMFSALEDVHFFRTPHQRPTMERNLRALLSRAQMTEQEVATFHGMVTAFGGGKQPPGSYVPPPKKTKT